MFTATESSETDALRQYGEALGSYLGEVTPLRFLNWDEAITLAPNGPLPVVIDEFRSWPAPARPCPRSSSVRSTRLGSARSVADSGIRLVGLDRLCVA